MSVSGFGIRRFSLETLKRNACSCPDHGPALKPKERKSTKRTLAGGGERKEQLFSLTAQGNAV